MFLVQLKLKKAYSYKHKCHNEQNDYVAYDFWDFVNKTRKTNNKHNGVSVRVQLTEGCF